MFHLICVNKKRAFLALYTQAFLSTKNIPAICVGTARRMCENQNNKFFHIIPFGAKIHEKCL